MAKLPPIPFSHCLGQPVAIIPLAGRGEKAWCPKKSVLERQLMKSTYFQVQLLLKKISWHCCFQALRLLMYHSVHEAVKHAAVSLITCGDSSNEDY